MENGKGTKKSKNKSENKNRDSRRKDRKAESKDTKQIILLLRSFGDEPVMVTMTFGEGRDAGKQS